MVLCFISAAYSWSILFLFLPSVCACLAVFRVSLRGDIFGKGQRSDGASTLAWKVVDFLAGGFVGASAEAATEASAGAAATGGTDDTVDADVYASGFVSCSTKQRTCICNVLF